MTRYWIVLIGFYCLIDNFQNDLSAAEKLTDQFKLVHYYNTDVDEWELLDRERDPLEVKNFYNDPAYAATVKRLQAELERLRKEVKEPEATPRRAYGNAPFDREPRKAGAKK